MQGYLYEFLRWIYRRVSILQSIRHIFRKWFALTMSNFRLIGNSRDNNLFLDVMATRRKKLDAICTARMVSGPIDWPDLDVTIVTFNSLKWLEMFFSSLRSQDYPLKKLYLYMVDNGSTDGTVAWIQNFLLIQKPFFGKITIIQSENKGYGAGHDAAIRCGCSTYCLVTNVDIEFLPNAICNAVRMAMSDNLGLVGSWEFRQYPYEHPKHYDPVTLETPWSSHACVLLRRSAYELCGGYDCNIFMYAEDVELSYRLRSFGYVLKYCPCSGVMHYTYESADLIKPIQFIGSVVGNVYLRVRYGSFLDKIFGLLLFIYYLLKPAPFKGAKINLVQSLFALFKKSFQNKPPIGPVMAYYPFYGVNYELRRQGAFVKGNPAYLTNHRRPLVSILVRTFEGRSFLLEQAIATVFNQSYPLIELIVSEDGGDTQKNIVETMAKQAPPGTTVQFITNPKSGRATAGNAALGAASGDYFIFLDDDDLLYADHVETLVQSLLENSSCCVAYSLGIEVLTNIDIQKQRYVELLYKNLHSLQQPWDYEVLKQRNFLLISALVSRKLFLERGGMDPRLDFMEDWNLWLRYGAGNKFIYVPKTTILFRTPACIKQASVRCRMLSLFHSKAKKSVTSLSDVI